jgi:hypothetical protein
MRRSERDLHQAQARVAQRILLPAAQEPDVRCDEQRRRQQQQKHFGPQVRHSVAVCILIAERGFTAGKNPLACPPGAQVPESVQQR